MVNIAKLILCALLTLLALLTSCNRNTNPDSVQTNNDSIQKYIGLAAKDTFSYYQRNQFNDKAFSLIALEQNDTLTRYYLSETTFNYLRLRNWNALNKTAKVLLQKATIKKDTLNIARYYRCTAGYYKHNKVYDSAFYHYSKAEKLYKKLGRNHDLGNVLLNKGIVQSDAGDFSGAEFSLARAEHLFKNLTNKEALCKTLITLGVVYEERNENQKALKLYLKARELINIYRLNNIDLTATCLNNLGNVYGNLDQLELADKILNEAINVKYLEKNYQGIYGHIFFNMAEIQIKRKNYHQAKDLYLKSISVLEKYKEYQSIIGSNIGLSNYYLLIKDTVNAIKFAKTAKNISEKSNLLFGVSESLQQLIKVDPKNASTTAQEYIKVNDSLQNTERNYRHKFARIAFETDEIQLQKESAVQDKVIITRVAVVVFLIGLLLFIITKQRSKQKELLLLQSQQKANEEIYQLMLAQKTIEEETRQAEKKRIALELHDGIMNKLASTRLNLFILSQKNDPETIASCLVHISQIHNIEQEIRNIAHDLNKDVFEETNSFIRLLEDFITDQNTTAKAHYALELANDIDWNGVSSEIKMNMFRIIQEASHNANKYSNANNVTIAIVQDFNNICMSIADNGVGFDPKTSKGGIGIQNMRQRIHLLKGKFTINSKEKNSTYINISIPMRLDKKGKQ